MELINKSFSSDAWSWSLIADCEFMGALTHSCAILSISAEPLPTGQVWQRQRVGMLPGRNDGRRMNWEVLGRLTMKSLWRGRKRRQEVADRLGESGRSVEWMSWQGWRIVIFRTNLKVEVRGWNVRLEGQAVPNDEASDMTTAGLEQK